MGPFAAIARLLDGILQLYLWIIFGAIIVSWIPMTSGNPTLARIKHILCLLTEPVFAFFRRTFRLDRFARPLDLAPIAAILAIHIVRLSVVQALQGASPVNVLFGVIFSALDFLLTIYFWIVAASAFFAIMICFFAHHPWARISIPFLAKLTIPVFEFLRQLFNSDLHIRFSSFPNPLDLAPFLVLLLITFVKSLLFFLASSL